MLLAIFSLFVTMQPWHLFKWHVRDVHKLWLMGAIIWDPFSALHKAKINQKSVFCVFCKSCPLDLHKNYF